MKGIALLPGAFKPPTRGHFNLVKNIASNNFKEASFEKTDKGEAVPGTLTGISTNKEVEKIIVFISSQPRNNITSDISKKIWDIYKKHLPNNVEIIDTKSDPVKFALRYVKENPDKMFFPIVGIRDELDFKDLGRLGAYEKYKNTSSLRYLASDEIRATNLRKAILEDDIQAIKDNLPEELTEQEFKKIYDMLKNNIKLETENIVYDKIGDIFDSFITDESLINEGSSGTPIGARSAIPSKDRARLINLYNQLRDTIYSPNYDIDFQQDRIVITLKDKARISYDYTPYMASLVEYMLENKFKITPLPEVKIKSDIVESSDFFGKTAFYDPYKKEITLYVMGRHPKDVMRSFSHEMIHHMQNLEGKINNISTTNTNEDGRLSKLEEEAYLLGNMTFRNWEDKIKNNL